MKNIAFVVPSVGRKGPINVVYNIVKYFNVSIYNVYIISLSDSPNNNRIKDFENLGCTVLNLKLSKSNALFFGHKVLDDIFSKNNIIMVHSNCLMADLLTSRLVSEYNILSTIHCITWLDFVMSRGKLIGSLLSYIHLKSIKRFKHKIFCSKALYSAYSERNIIGGFIRNGIDSELFYSIEDKSSLRIKLNLPLDKEIFISCGVLIERKCPELLIESFKRMSNSNFVLLFLGEGVLYEKCKLLSNDDPNIIMTGNVHNVSEYLQCSDYFISASLAEGLPNSVMEALGCGLPCILSDIEPHKEILDLDNNAGKVFKVNDINSFISAVNTRSDFRKQSCIDIIGNHLSAKIMSQKYQDYYKSIIKT